MAVELILLEDVKYLGLAGDVVEVAPGYARNYLLPKNLAKKVSPGALRQIEARREMIEAQRQAKREQSMSLKERIDELEITIQMNAGEDDRLYGSVNENMIADALEKDGISVEARNIIMKDHLKELGAFNVEVKLDHDIVANLKIWVVRA
jgi:large subunit ribosomal protein L9